MEIVKRLNFFSTHTKHMKANFKIFAKQNASEGHEKDFDGIFWSQLNVQFYTSKPLRSGYD